MKRRQTTGAVLLALLLMLTATLSAVPVTAEAGTLTLVYKIVGHGTEEISL